MGSKGGHFITTLFLLEMIRGGFGSNRTADGGNPNEKDCPPNLGKFCRFWKAVFLGFVLLKNRKQRAASLSSGFSGFLFDLVQSSKFDFNIFCSKALGSSGLSDR